MTVNRVRFAKSNRHGELKMSLYYYYYFYRIVYVRTEYDDEIKYSLSFFTSRTCFFSPAEIFTRNVRRADRVFIRVRHKYSHVRRTITIYIGKKRYENKYKRCSKIYLKFEFAAICVLQFWQPKKKKKTDCVFEQTFINTN